MAQNTAASLGRSRRSFKKTTPMMTANIVLVSRRAETISHGRQGERPHHQPDRKERDHTREETRQPVCEHNSKGLPAFKQNDHQDQREAVNKEEPKSITVGIRCGPDA